MLLRQHIADSEHHEGTGLVRRIKFPQAWRVNDKGVPPDFSYVQQLEVRRLPDASTSEFFFAALPYGDNDYSYEVYPNDPKPTYSTNYYAINFDEDLRVRAVSTKEWNRARRVLSNRAIFMLRRARARSRIAYVLVWTNSDKDDVRLPGPVRASPNRLPRSLAGAHFSWPP